MTSTNPESELVTNFTSNTKYIPNKGTPFTIAPGEGKVPTNFLREDNWDVKTFPTLHPTGRYGMSYLRTRKLSCQNYVVQRLLNHETRFSLNVEWSFAMAAYIERDQLESAINVSCQRGKASNMGKVITLEDGFSVFQKIKMSTKYWQQAKFELLAKQEQLGPFHMFFTLSCADRLWPETFSTICSRRGHVVESGEVTIDSDNSVVYTSQATVDGIPIEQFLETQNLHQLIQEDVLSVTRVFDNRLKAFIKHIVKGSSNPMCVSNYNYRIEFQRRGMPHCHGVLWFDLTEREREAIDSIYDANFEDTDERYKTAVEFIDAHITCSTDTDEELAELVRNVQCHNHSMTCRKTGKECRFGYPRPPSDKTLFAKPLPISMDIKKAKELIKNTLRP